MVQYCPECRQYQFYPRPFCVRCSCESLEWREISGLGTVYSFTVVWRPPLPDWPVPYVVAIVELDEGVRLLANVISEDALDVHIGSRVRVAFERQPDDWVLPQFMYVSDEKARIGGPGAP